MSLMQLLLLTFCVVYSLFLQITVCMTPEWETWCCNIILAYLRWCLFLTCWSKFLSWKGDHSACIVPVLLWIQSLTVASSCMVPSAPLTWYYPRAPCCFAPMLVRSNLLPACVVWKGLDLLLTSLIHCLHDIHLPGNPSWFAGQLLCVASSGSLSCLDRGIELLSCSSPSRWFWMHMEW